jgi:hypothetical protein
MTAGVALMLSMVVINALACGQDRAGTGLAIEPPPPPVEPVLAAGSRLIDERADELVRRMGDLLAGATSFALEAVEVYDEVPEHTPRQQLANRRYVALRRPDRLVGDATGDALNRSVWYDGREFSVLDKEQFTYATVAAPATIDEALDAIFEQTGVVVPLADFVYLDVYDRLMAGVQRGVYLGIHDVEGLPCHHLSFEQETIDWQLWIDAVGDPLPRKLVIAYKTEDEVPQYAVTIVAWNLNAEVPDDVFRFEPPEGAERVELPVLAQPPVEEQQEQRP